MLVGFEFLSMHLESKEMLSDVRQMHTEIQTFLCIQFEFVNKMINK